MATLNLQVNEDLLGRARLNAERLGSSIQKVIVDRLEELASAQVNEQYVAINRALARAKVHPSFGSGPMPNRDERNER